MSKQQTAVERAAEHSRDLETARSEVTRAQGAVGDAEETARRHRVGAEVLAKERSAGLAKAAMDRDPTALTALQKQDASARTQTEGEQASRDGTVKVLREALEIRKAELAALEEQTPKAVRAAILELAESAAMAYRQHAEALEPLACRLVALNNLAGRLAQGTDPDKIALDRRRWQFLREDLWIGIGAVKLPSTPQLEAFQGRRSDPGSTAAIVHKVRAETSIFDDEDIRQSLPAATSAVLEELAAAGVPTEVLR